MVFSSCKVKAHDAPHFMLLHYTTIWNVFAGCDAGAGLPCFVRFAPVVSMLLRSVLFVL